MLGTVTLPWISLIVAQPSEPSRVVKVVPFIELEVHHPAHVGHSGYQHQWSPYSYVQHGRICYNCNKEALLRSTERR
jgi:hypothetical protein